jgi:hypothetical protein
MLKKIHALGFGLKILSPFLFSSLAIANGSCEVIANDGAGVYAYCSHDITLEEMSDFAAETRDKYMNQQLNQVHIFIFDNKFKTPRTGNEFWSMPGDEVEQHQIGILNVNRNTGYSDYYCRKYNEMLLVSCESFLK